MPPMRWVFLGLAAAAILGCGRASSEGLARPPVVIISIDTLRSDHLPAYGFRGVRTPTGIRDNAGFRLDPGRATLAEVLKQNGYATGAAVSAYVLRADTGINRGFDFFDDRIVQRADQSLGGIQRNGVETAKAAGEWLTAHAAQPFFLLLHLYEPHSPTADNFAAVVDTMKVLDDTKGALYWSARGRRQYPRDARFRR